MAYADFVTAMMALFIVLWIVGQSKDVKEAVAPISRTPGLHGREERGIMSGPATSKAVNAPVAPDKEAGRWEGSRQRRGTSRRR